MALIAQHITEEYALYNGDACEILPSIPDDRIHLSVYSPPFATKNGALYTYSSDPRDLSNSLTYKQFFDHYMFIVKEIYRVTMPGRMTGVHCMDVPSGNSGTDHLLDFPGDIIRTHVRCRKPNCTASKLEKARGLCGHGWFRYTGRYHIWKEPLTVRNRTMAKNLAHKTIVEDSSRCSLASADYLLMFRKVGSNPVPIVHPVGLLEYAGAREIPREKLKYRGWTGNQIENRYSHWIWRQYASAFWDDIRLERVLPYEEARDPDDERHVHPLQGDVIDRCVTLWSNPGEKVLSPCSGVGSEIYYSVRQGRKGIGIELKPSYHKQAVYNLGKVNEPESWQEQIDFGEAQQALD